MPRITSRAIAIAAALVLSPAGARADAVADWSRIALDSVLESRQSTPDALNTLATVHAAMFETFNFIEASYTPRYVVSQPSPVKITGDAAAGAAAHYVLVEAFPDRRATFDEALPASSDPIARGLNVSPARILGRSLATIVSTVRRRSPTAPAQGAPAIDPQAWNRVVDLVESESLRPIERARIYALVSTAADEAMTAASRIERSGPIRAVRPCAPCAVQAAVESVLQSELGSKGFAHSLPSLIVPDAPSVVQVNFVFGADESVAAGRELGARIGSHVSGSFYRPRNE